MGDDEEACVSAEGLQGGEEIGFEGVKADLGGGFENGGEGG
jgi:hypothetical protein